MICDVENCSSVPVLTGSPEGLTTMPMTSVSTSTGRVDAGKEREVIRVVYCRGSVRAGQGK